MLAATAVVLALPSLCAGLLGDDYIHRIVLLGIGEWGEATTPIRDLFAFVPEGLRDRMTELGDLPWWSDPEIRISFPRPVTALTHVLDSRVWPDRFVLQHLHSLLWFGLGVGLVATLYRRLHDSAAVAGVAGLLFAAEDAHAMAAGWLANRNALLCLVFGTLTILAHVAWRRCRAPRQLGVSLGLLAIGLGCGEATLGALAYVVAWQLTREKGPLARRLLPLAPYGGVVLGWRYAYDGLGYGTVGSSLYLDPARQPLTFLAALLERWPILFAAQWTQAPVDFWLVLPRSAQLAVSVLSAAVVALLLIHLWGLLREDPAARFWVVGMALSLVPFCAAFPMDRLLLFCGIGAFGVMAMLLRSQGVWLWERPRMAGWRRRAAVVLLVVHGPLAALALVGRTAALPMLGEVFSAGARLSPTDERVREQTLVYVNGNDFAVVYTRIIRVVEGSAAVPRRVAQLASMVADTEVLREDDHTLLVTPEHGFLSSALDRLLASPTRRFAAGELVERPDYIAEIRAITADGRPARVAFRFRRPLCDPSLRFLQWKSRELVEFPLPPIGSSVVVAAAI